MCLRVCKRRCSKGYVLRATVAGIPKFIDTYMVTTGRRSCVHQSGRLISLTGAQHDAFLLLLRTPVLCRLPVHLLRRRPSGMQDRR
jgi:hypothetical protein